MMTLATRIGLERRNRPPSEILELNLDNSKASEIEGLTDEYENLVSLSLINVGLQTLKGFPALKKLRKLELSDNRISGGLNNLENCENLEHLSLSGNKIKDTETLKPLASLKKLRSVDLYNCEVTDSENYRKDIFNILPSITYLDGFDINNEEEPEDEEDDNDLDEDDEDDDAIVDEEDTLDDDDLLCDDDEDGEEEEDEDDIGLSALQNDDLEDDNEDYVPDNDGLNDDEDEIDEGEDGEAPESSEDQRRGVKRKYEEGGEEESNEATNP